MDSPTKFYGLCFTIFYQIVILTLSMRMPIEKLIANFAQAIAEGTSEDDYIWVQDYLLSLVARELREIGVKRQTGFFLHTPFPPFRYLYNTPVALRNT